MENLDFGSGTVSTTVADGISFTDEAGTELGRFVTTTGRGENLTGTVISTNGEYIVHEFGSALVRNDGTRETFATEFDSEFEALYRSGRSSLASPRTSGTTYYGDKDLSDGREINYVIYTRYDARAAIGYVGVEGGQKGLMAAGPELSGALQGQFSYRGGTLATFRDAPVPSGQGTFNARMVQGHFTMEVDFDTAQITSFISSASVPNQDNVALGASGSGIEIDTSDGTFSGSVTLTGSLVGVLPGMPETATGSIFGNFHEVNAAGVTGVYFDGSRQEASATYIGAFAGNGEPTE